MRKQFAFLSSITITALIQLVGIGVAFSQSPDASLYRPITAYHYATPFTEVRSLNDISVRFVNKETTAVANVMVKAEIHEPNGNWVVLNAIMPNVEAGVDTLFQFPAYLPPSIKGEFEVVFTNNIYNDPQDTVRRKFIHSDYTFASDNGVVVPGGVGPSDSTFIAADFFMQCGSLFFTGANAACFFPRIIFGISNAQEIYVQGDPGANFINVLLYDADFDEDGHIDLEANWDDLGPGLVGYEFYEIKGTETPDALLSVEINDINTDHPLSALKPFHPYYAALSYDGVEAGLSKCVRFSKSAKVDYPDFPTTPVFLGQMMHHGWEDGTVILRFKAVTPFDATQAPSTEMQLSIAPNPAGEVLQIDLDLDVLNTTAAVSLLNWQGHQVQTLTLQNFQQGQLTFQTKDLPAGIYLINVNTSSGSATRKLVIGH